MKITTNTTPTPTPTPTTQQRLHENLQTAIANCLVKTDLTHKYHQGKVRDGYDLGKKILLVTTDRLSAFDRQITNIPLKGQVLNQLTHWWYQQTQDLIPNAFMSAPDPNAMLLEKCTPYPIEFVVRAYLTGSTSTSIWHLYQQGQRKFGTLTLPDGMQKNAPLPYPILTPSTKDDGHDVPISAKEIIDSGRISKKEWIQLEGMALTLFQMGQKIALEKDLILVDTKYEFGRNEAHQIKLIDEVHTPDSSRYWRASSYLECHQQGLEPESFDKEIIRLWYKQHCNPYEDEVLPEAPVKLIEKVASCYIEIYEALTGQTLEWSADEDTALRLKKNCGTLFD